MVAAHAECLKFLKDNVTSARLRLQKRASQSEERALRDKQTLKRLLAFELLFNNLALLLMIPEMLEEVEADIEELKICFTKLGLTTSAAEENGKRSKKKAGGASEEALDVLVDFLISLLTKPQSFLRDIANFTFKQFCTQLSAKALANLVSIVQTPNVEATKMLFDQEDVEEADEEDGEDEDESEDDEDSEESD